MGKGSFSAQFTASISSWNHLLLHYLYLRRGVLHSDLCAVKKNALLECLHNANEIMAYLTKLIFPFLFILLFGKTVACK